MEFVKKAFILLPLAITALVIVVYLQVTSNIESSVLLPAPIHRVKPVVLAKPASETTIPTSKPVQTQPRPIEEPVEQYKEDLAKRGIVFSPGFPDHLVERTYKVFQHVPEASNITLTYKSSGFVCGDVKVTVGCLYVLTRTIEITDKVPGTFWATVSQPINRSYAYEFVLLHEVGHTLGIVSEADADAFAFKYLELKSNR